MREEFRPEENEIPENDGPIFVNLKYRKSRLPGRGKQNMFVIIFVVTLLKHLREGEFPWLKIGDSQISTYGYA